MTDIVGTTGFEIPGHRVAETLGVVRGVVVRSRSIVGYLGAALQTLFGGNITLLTPLCERARADADLEMLRHAQLTRADAVIGVRYDTTEIFQSATEVLRYGTAVRLERVR